jgi:hypothetical protein
MGIRSKRLSHDRSGDIIGRMTVTRASARHARIKLSGSILTTHGYAILGLAAIQPLLSNSGKLTLAQICGAIVGLAAQLGAIYIAPYGEAS